MWTGVGAQLVEVELLLGEAVEQQVEAERRSSALETLEWEVMVECPQTALAIFWGQELTSEVLLMVRCSSWLLLQGYCLASS